EVQVDPCVDFFEFTCGNWIAAHPIPSDETSRTQLHVLSDKVLKQMRGKVHINALESPEIFASKSMNAPEVYIPQIDFPQSYGVWPMVDGDDKWRVENFNLTSLMIHVSKVRGLQVFILYRILEDKKNTSRRIIEVRTVSNFSLRY
ncbi:hypothetical protein COOONC_23065, partial [Cooperia oncophora]